METIRISDIKPAEYNPRKISDEGFENLKKSLQELGVIKPILVNAENSVIIAGHQRTKAMQAIGITECMAFILKNVDYHDECRFNQLHNKCEIELSEEAPEVKITKPLKLGINIVEPKYIEVQKIGRTAQFTQHLAFLLLKYGEYGLPICHQDGNVAISSSYALACRNCNKNMHILVLEDEKIERAKFYMSKDGFHLKKTKEHPLETILPSVMREWDMQLPNGKSYGLQDYIKDSLTKVYNNENRSI